MILDGWVASNLQQGVQALRAGKLLAMPTETVYGLAADAENEAAVRRIFALKQRPADHPLIVHVKDEKAALHFAAQVPGFARRLMQHFWPGPLSLILPYKNDLSTVVTGGQNSVGLRCPSHPVAQDLLAACARAGIYGLAAPSANRFGRVSPTTAAHVEAEFGPQLLILDGGACAVGIESAIVDCSRGMPVLLRPGQLQRAQIESLLGQDVLLPGQLADSPAPRASGNLTAHYAPQARVCLLDRRQLQAALQAPDIQAARTGIWARADLLMQAENVIFKRMPVDAQAAARQLFAVLRDFDAARVGQIWVEAPPDDEAWDGVRDRLQRAAASG